MPLGMGEVVARKSEYRPPDQTWPIGSGHLPAQEKRRPSAYRKGEYHHEVVSLTHGKKGQQYTDKSIKRVKRLRHECSAMGIMEVGRKIGRLVKIDKRLFYPPHIPVGLKSIARIRKKMGEKAGGKVRAQREEHQRVKDGREEGLHPSNP